jgi:hypothetical protein
MTDCVVIPSMQGLLFMIQHEKDPEKSAEICHICITALYRILPLQSRTNFFPPNVCPLYTLGIIRLILTSLQMLNVSKSHYTRLLSSGMKERWIRQRNVAMYRINLEFLVFLRNYHLDVPDNCIIVHAEGIKVSRNVHPSTRSILKKYLVFSNPDLVSIRKETLVQFMRWRRFLKTTWIHDIIRKKVADMWAPGGRMCEKGWSNCIGEGA